MRGVYYKNSDTESRRRLSKGSLGRPTSKISKNKQKFYKTNYQMIKTGRKFMKKARLSHLKESKM